MKEDLRDWCKSRCCNDSGSMIIFLKQMSRIMMLKRLLRMYEGMTEAEVLRKSFD